MNLEKNKNIQPKSGVCCRDDQNSLQLFCHNINNEWHVVSSVLPIILAISMKYFKYSDKDGGKVEKIHTNPIGNTWLNIPAVN